MGNSSSGKNIEIKIEGQSVNLTREQVTDLFHLMFYHDPEKTWKNSTFMGIPVWKNPLDLWIIQEIIFQTKPDIIIETGSFFKGSAVYMAILCELRGKGNVYTIDVKNHAPQLQHPRMHFFHGSSTSEKIFQSVKTNIKPEDKVMVLLDSEHKKEHVAKELEMYHALVTVGNYLIVEDTDINGHPVHPDFGPGPMEALNDFLPRHPEFEIDESREKFFLTQNPRGFLKRIR